MVQHILLNYNIYDNKKIHTSAACDPFCDDFLCFIIQQ